MRPAYIKMKFVWPWETEFTCRAKRMSDGAEVIGYVIGEAPNTYVVPLSVANSCLGSSLCHIKFRATAIRVVHESIEFVKLQGPVVSMESDNYHPVEIKPGAFLTTNIDYPTQFTHKAIKYADGQETVGYIIGEEISARMISIKSVLPITTNVSYDAISLFVEADRILGYTAKPFALTLKSIRSLCKGDQ